MRVIPNERNICLEINWRYAILFLKNTKNNTFFCHESRRRFVLSLSILCIYMTNVASGENNTFLAAF